MNLPRAVAGTIGARIVTYAFAMVTGVLIARLLGPTDRGIYGVLINTMSILHAIGSLGIGSANVYYVAQKHNVSRIVSNSLGIGTGVSVLLVTCFLLFFMITQERLFPGVTVPLAVIAVAVTPAVLLHGYLSGILWGQSRVAALNLLSIALAVLQLTAIILIMTLLELGILELLTITLIIAFFDVAVLLFLVKQTQTTHISFTLDWTLIRQMGRFSGAAYGANVLSLLAVRSDLLFLNFFVGGAAVGHYAVAATMAQLMLLIPDSVQRVLFVRFSDSNAQEANQLVPLVSRTMVFLMSAFALMAALLAGPIVRLLLGANYDSSATLLALLLPGVIAGSSRSVSSSYLTGRGRPDVPMVVAFVSLVVTIGIDLVLIPRMGATGAAIAASAANIVGAALQLAVVLRWSGASLSDVLFLKRQDPRYILTHLLNRRPTIPM